MQPIQVHRTIQIPDLLRISRYQKAPELGPSILFFSGGSALRQMSRVLKSYTHNSIHLVTPFDSGGSSAKLRQAFDMPAIGDLRSRLMTLADETITGHPEVYRLFTYRFPKDAADAVLKKRLRELTAGRDPMIMDVPNPMRRLIRTQLGYFQDAMPADFELQGASIGNLILTGGYLNNHKHLDPIIFLFSKLVGVLGTVRAVVNDNLHLAAELKDGTRIIGQHRLTGKEVPQLTSPIEHLYLVDKARIELPVKSVLRKKNRKLIQRAELICYPPGSFYSSLIANFLPAGVGSAVAANAGPKLYIPNLGRDPEQIGMTMDQSILRLLSHLRADAGSDCPESRLLNFVMLDSRRGNYTSLPDPSLMNNLKVRIIDTELISKESAPYYDPKLLAAALLSLC
ncbi:MAG: GAK system CofD-like protein [Gammaproteobacteria bacterium]|nr:GAK system CofD-like protein [Gammaproteobacteria bacterium]